MNSEYYLAVFLQKSSMLKLILLAFSLLLLSLTAAAQEDLREYEGGYTFNGLRGNAEFTYYLDAEQEPILEGDFVFRFIKLDSLTKENLRKLSIDGVYKTYQKDKKWDYLLENHQILIRDFEDREIKADVDSKLVELEASYAEGTLSGTWNYAEKIWLGEQYFQSFTANELQFENDRLSGKVVFEDNSLDNPYRIIGTVSEDGLLDGSWEFYYNQDGSEVKETRRYENGFLIGLQKINEITSEKIDEVVFFNAIERLDSLNQGFEPDFSVSDQFFGLTFNDGFAEQSKEYQGQYRGTFLLEDALLRVLQFEHENFIDGGKLVRSPIRTRRFRYNISGNDEENYGRIIEIFESLQSSANVESRSNFLELNRNSSDSLALASAYFKNLNNKLEDFKGIVNLFESEEIRYLDPANFLRDGLDFISERDTIRYQYKGEPKQQIIDYSDVAEVIELSDDVLKYLQKEAEILAEFEAFVSENQQQFRQSQDLESIEATILREKNKLDSLYENINVVSDEHQRYLDSFYENLAETQYQSLLDSYNEHEVFEEKAMRGDEILELIQFAKSRMPYLERVSKLEDEITALFTEKTLDPFTFETDFEVIRQKGVYEAALMLINHETELLINTTDYNEASQRFITLENLLIRLTKLRGSDTRRLERNLNAAGQDINQIKNLLSL